MLNIIKIISARIKSIGYAFEGLKTLFKEEPNALIHGSITLIVIIAGFYFEVSNTEWIALLFAIGLVFGLELINTAIENICNLISIERNEQIKKIKDLSAAAVLVAAVISVIIGVIVFIPKIITI
jgi:diacylglycerol kinase